VLNVSEAFCGCSSAVVVPAVITPGQYEKLCCCVVCMSNWVLGACVCFSLLA
jgi:hypothetical protein